MPKPLNMLAPYKLHPVAPLVALLLPDGTIVSEYGDPINVEKWPAGYRAWCSYDTVRELILSGQGEALCWNREEIKWRHRRFENEWKPRPSDVNVIKLPFYEEPAKSLRALCSWRDWLASYGAAPTSTTGSAAWSLLRARLLQPLWLSVGETPPLRATLGGRQELGPAGKGRFEGMLEHFDLPAAYASALGGLRYGGRWIQNSTFQAQHDPEWWAKGGRAVFVRARVRIPPMRYGPLPRRPRKPVYGLRSILQGASYPTGVTMQGIWTWQELEAAERHGCKILKVLETWAHLAGDKQPFRHWWTAIQAGRQMPGLAGLLAKTTGNALWGRFCMDSVHNGERSIASREGKHLAMRPLPITGGLPPAHDLAETVSGRVRAELYELMQRAGGSLVSAHTDGAWTCDITNPVPPGWRLKEAARRLDLLDPQVLRYWPAKAAPSEPWVVFAGVPTLRAESAFERAWEDAGFAA